MRARLLLPLAALLAAGCAAPRAASVPAPAGAIVLSADRSAYRAGDTATLTLRNGTAEPLGYNLCSSSRQMRSAAAWAAVDTQRMCTRELRILNPGASATYAEPITRDWRPGEYRIAATVSRMRTGTAEELVTPAFTVRP